MPLSNEVQELIRSTIAVEDARLRYEMSQERRAVAGSLASKGQFNSGSRVVQEIDVIEGFIKKRMTAFVDIYLKTLGDLSIKMDVELETEIFRQLEGMLGLAHEVVLPTMSFTDNSVIEKRYRAPLEKAETQALTDAKNRVRLVRLKDAQPPPSTQPSIISNHNYAIHGSNGRINFGSTDNSINTTGAHPPDAPKEDSKSASLSFSDRLAIALACLAGVLALILMWVEKTPVWAGATVSGMVGLVVYPVHHFIRSWAWKTLALTAVLGIIALFGWAIWPRPVSPPPVVAITPAAAKPTATPSPSVIDEKPRRQKSKFPILTILQLSISGSKKEALITAEQLFRHPVFVVRCNAPCTFTGGGAVSLAYRAGIVETSEDSTLVTVPIEVPGEVKPGQQIYLDFVPKGDTPISIRSVNGYPVRVEKAAP